MFIRLFCLHSDALSRSATCSAAEADSAMTSTRLWREIRQFDELMEKFRALNVDATEYASLKGIVLFKTGACFRSAHMPLIVAFINER